MRVVRSCSIHDGRATSSTRRAFPSTEQLPLRWVCAFGTALIVTTIFACKHNPVGTTHESESGVSTANQGAGVAVPSRPKPIATSIVQLIASPDRFDGSDVLVGGYLYVEKGEEVDATLVSSPDDAMRGLGVSVELAFSRCGEGAPNSMPAEDIGTHDRRFVRIRGKFVAANGGLKPGTICSIQEIVDVPEPTEADLRRFCPREGMPGVCARVARKLK